MVENIKMGMHRFGVLGVGWVVGMLGTEGCLWHPRLDFPPAVLTDSVQAEDWPDAGVAVLEDIATLEYRLLGMPSAGPKRLVAVLDHRRRMKILRDTGLTAADVTLPVDGYARITQVVGRSIQPNGRQSRVDTLSLNVQERPDAQERAPEVKLLHFHIPDASVGGWIEYRYECIYTDPHLVPPWVFGTSAPILHAEFGFIPPPQSQVDYRYAYGEHPVDRVPLRRERPDGRTAWVFIEKDVPAFYPEPLMPSLTRVAPWVALALRTSPTHTSIPRLETWDDVGRYVLQRMAYVQGSDASPAVSADRTHACTGLACAGFEPYENLRALLHPLLLPGLGVRPPQSAPALRKGTPACSRDAAALLWKSLTDVHVPAFPALLTNLTGPPVIQDFPALYPFVRAGVAVKLQPDMLRRNPAEPCNLETDFLKQDWACALKPGDFLWLDPLCDACTFGQLPANLAAGQALVIQPDHSTWVDLPAIRPQTHAVQTRFQLTLETEGHLTGSMEGQAQGSPAEAARTALSNANQVVHRAQALQHFFEGDEGGADLQQFKVTAQDNTEKPLRVSAHVNAQASKQAYQQYQLRPRDLMGSSVPHLWRGQRQYPALLLGPYWHETYADIQLPLDYQLQTQAQLKIACPFAEYAAGFAIHGRVLAFSRRWVLKVSTLKAQDWPEFLDFINQIRDFEATGVTVGLQEDA